MNTADLAKRALAQDFLSVDEGTYMFENMPTTELMAIGHEIRMKMHPEEVVTWKIDRNANTTNVCVANCKFCNFFVPPNGHPDSYITTIDEYKEKIEETLRYGGDQLLLQGGHHPDLGIDYYEDLFKTLKGLYPEMKLHALGPPEIVHISDMAGLTYRETLERLVAAGMDSLPGAGAEILTDRVRREIANGKCSAQEWLDVMRAAHQMGLGTSASMMLGHIETVRERFVHLDLIRQVQTEKPEGAPGFVAFIPWPFQDEGTLLARVKSVYNTVTADEYVRFIAMARIMLPNFEHIQTSWLTVGKEVGQMCLHAGADDFGSIMIEENVVSAAGAPHRFTSNEIQKAIIEAGYTPRLRDQGFNEREIPEGIEQQVINY